MDAFKEFKEEYGPIENWNTFNVTNIGKLFNEYGEPREKNFDEDVSNWNVFNVESIEKGYKYDNFSYRVDNCTLRLIVNDYLINGEDSKYYSIMELLDTSYVTDMSDLFSPNKENLNSNRDIDIDIRKWNLIRVINIDNIFEGATFTKEIFEKYTKYLNPDPDDIKNRKININYDNRYYLFKYKIILYQPEDITEEIKKIDEDYGAKYTSKPIPFNNYKERLQFRIYTFLYNTKQLNQNSINILNNYGLKKNRAEVLKNYGPMGNWNIDDATDLSKLFSDYVLDYYPNRVNTIINSVMKNFNEDICDWNVSNVTNMESMFKGCELFDKYINNWDVSNVTNMKSMFKGCQSFNRDISNWDVSNVINMSSMFENAKSFNSNIFNIFNTNINDLSYMFKNAKSFNNEMIKYWSLPINNGTNKGDTDRNLSGMFENAISFNQDISTKIIKAEDCIIDQAWDTKWIKNMSHMFFGAINFNQNISNWELGSLLDMQYMFANAKSFNNGSNDINNIRWAYTLGDSNGINYEYGKDVNVICPDGYTIIIKSIDNLNNKLEYNTKMKSITDLHKYILTLKNDKTHGYGNVKYMYGKNDINNKIINYDYSDQTIKYYVYFEQLEDNDKQANKLYISTDENTCIKTIKLLNIGSWSFPSNVKNMSHLFYGAESFNQDISNWYTYYIENMEFMFANAISFNQEIKDWKVDNVTNMEFMFANAKLFNQDISNWTVNNVENMNYMFYLTEEFQQDLTPWYNRMNNLKTYKNMFLLSRLMNIYQPNSIPTKMNNDKDIYFNRHQAKYAVNMIKDEPKLAMPKLAMKTMTRFSDVIRYFYSDDKSYPICRISLNIDTVYYNKENNNYSRPYHRINFIDDMKKLTNTHDFYEYSLYKDILKHWAIKIKIRDGTNVKYTPLIPLYTIFNNNKPDKTDNIIYYNNPDDRGKNITQLQYQIKFPLEEQEETIYKFPTMGEIKWGSFIERSSTDNVIDSYGDTITTDFFENDNIHGANAEDNDTNIKNFHESLAVYASKELSNSNGYTYELKQSSYNNTSNSVYDIEWYTYNKINSNNTIEYVFTIENVYIPINPSEDLLENVKEVLLKGLEFENDTYKSGIVFNFVDDTTNKFIENTSEEIEVPEKEIKENITEKNHIPQFKRTLKINMKIESCISIASKNSRMDLLDPNKDNNLNKINNNLNKLFEVYKINPIPVPSNFRVYFDKRNTKKTQAQDKLLGYYSYMRDANDNPLYIRFSMSSTNKPVYRKYKIKEDRAGKEFFDKWENIFIFYDDRNGWMWYEIDNFNDTYHFIRNKKVRNEIDDTNYRNEIKQFFYNNPIDWNFKYWSKRENVIDAINDPEYGEIKDDKVITDDDIEIDGKVYEIDFDKSGFYYSTIPSDCYNFPKDDEKKIILYYRTFDEDNERKETIDERLGTYNIKYSKIISNGELVNSEYPYYKNEKFQYEHENGKYYIYTEEGENGKQVVVETEDSVNNISYYIQESPGNDDKNIYYTTPIEIEDNFTVYYAKYNKSLKKVQQDRYLLGLYTRITKFGKPDKGFTIESGNDDIYSKDYPFYVNTTSNRTMYIYYNIKRNEWSWSSNYKRYELDENNQHNNYNYRISKNIPSIDHAYYKNDIRKIIEDYYFYSLKPNEIVKDKNISITHYSEAEYIDIAFFAHSFIYDIKKNYKSARTFGDLKDRLIKYGLLNIKYQTKDLYGEDILDDNGNPIKKYINKSFYFHQIYITVFDNNWNETEVNDNTFISSLFPKDEDHDNSANVYFKCNLFEEYGHATYFIEENKDNTGKYIVSFFSNDVSIVENNHSLIEPLELSATNYNSNTKNLTFNIVNNNTNTTNPDGSIYIGFNNTICYQLDKYNPDGYYLYGNNYEFDLTSNETDIINNNDNKSFSIKDMEIDNGMYKLNISTPTGKLISQVFLIKGNKLVIPFTVNITKYENNKLYFKIKNNTDTDLIISRSVMYVYLYKNVRDSANDSMEINSVNIKNNSESEFNILINSPTNGDKYKIEVSIRTPYENIISDWYTINIPSSNRTGRISMNNVFSIKTDKNSQSTDTTIFNKIRHKKKIH